MNTIKKVFNWLVVSSADPSQMSLTVKGILTAIIPMVLTLTGLAHLSITSGDLNNWIGVIANLVDIALVAVAAIWAAYGAVRKVVLTIEGKNLN